MLLVDTSVWIDHLRRNNDVLVNALNAGQVLCHDFVLGELAMGNLRDRSAIIGSLTHLPHATLADDDEVIGLIDKRALYGRGLGYIDAHLLASTLLTPDARLWTGDMRLRRAADGLGIAHRPPE